MSLVASASALASPVRRGGLRSAHRRWLLVNALAFAAIINGVVNGTIAWLSTTGRNRVGLWASPLSGPSLIVDSLLTLLLLPLLACAIVTTSVWRDRRRGDLPPLDAISRRPSAPMELPQGRILRGAIFGGLALVLLGPPVAALLLALDPGHVSVVDFVAYKSLFAVALGAIVTPLAAVWAMTDTLEPPLAVDAR